MQARRRRFLFDTRARQRHNARSYELKVMESVRDASWRFAFALCAVADMDAIGRRFYLFAAGRNKNETQHYSCNLHPIGAYGRLRPEAAG